MPALDVTPRQLRVFTAHGVELSKVNEPEAVGECPWCGKRKFYVKTETTQWDCKVCAKSGNNYDFLRLMWEVSHKHTTTKEYGWLVKHRGIPEEALRAWGVCKQAVTGEWVVPSYGVSGRLNNLYRYVLGSDNKYYLGGTSGIGVGMFLPLGGFDDSRPTIHFCEGLWDAIAWWYCLSVTDPEKARMVNVVGIPGCNNFQESWASVCEGKEITFLFDNDHPRQSRDGKGVIQPAFAGVRRSVDIISRVPADESPKSVSWLDWSGGSNTGYSPDRPDGYDLRDHLSMNQDKNDKGGKEGSEGRGDGKDEGSGVEGILSLVRSVPPEWTANRASRPKGANRDTHLRPAACKSWKELTGAWRIAAKWDTRLEGALAICLASIVSVKGRGEQLWIKLMSPASTYKSKLCGAFAVARKYVVEDDGMNGFFSGYNNAAKGEEVKDHSLAARLFDKTLVTKEGATLVDSPMKDVIISQGRALYDRDSSKSYNNGLRWEYDELSFTWILSGTPEALKRLDKSELGARFIDYCIMKEVEPEYEDAVLNRSLYQQANAGISNCEIGSSMDPDYKNACQLTGGYIEYLRRAHDAGELPIPIPSDQVIKRIGKLAKFIEFMRARPSTHQDEFVTRSLATRVGGQLVKLARYLAVVMQRKEVDAAVMRIIEKVASDTSEGRTLDIVKALDRAGTMGLDLKGVSIGTRVASHKEGIYLEFLTRIKAIEQFDNGLPSLARAARWRLTPEFRRLYREVRKESHD